jgi:hypothetical protein
MAGHAVILFAHGARPVLSELPGMLDFIADAATRGPA